MTANKTNIKHPCFLELNKDINKRYVLIFNIWDNKKCSKSITQYDTIDEVKEEYMFINELYANTPRPKRIPKEDNYRRRYGKKEYNISYEGGARFWGYIIIDYDKNEIIKIHNDGLLDFEGKTITLRMKDFYLRKPGEIPEDYTFECNAEYEGWLQYRWGNKKNAVDYVAPPKPKKKPKNLFEEFGYDYETHGLMEFPEPEYYDTEIIENKFADLLDKETKQRLLDRW